MAGSLFHARVFQEEWYTANDKKQHYEILPVDGDIDVISISSWRTVEKLFQQIGFNVSDLPTYETDIDLDLTDVTSRNKKLFQFITTQKPDFDDYWATRVVQYIESGELVFFCGD